MARRRRLRRLTLTAVAVLAATVGVAPAVSAHADPVPPDPTPVAAAPAPAPAPAGADHVSIAHVDGGAAQLRSAVRTATAAGLDVRHTFAGQHSFSVATPSASDRAQVAALPAVTGVEKPVSRTFSGVPSTGPDDPKLPSQSAYLDAVNAVPAWAQQHGSPKITIAVLDSGFDVGHPDLAGKFIATYNAHNGGTSVTDSIGHGTFVAGVAAADTDNGIGVAGAGYDTRLLGVKIADRYGDISIDDEVAGIRWAVAHGADVINLSVGGPDSSRAEQDAIEAAQSAGVLVVAAAGNESASQKEYPAAYSGVVSVAATDPARRTRASFSDYGSWITLAAPGTNIYSTVPLAGSEYFPTHSGYAAANGTSFSTPLVAGEAALVKAQNPAMSLATLRRVLVESAHGYGHLGLGAGQVDFAAALGHVAPTTRPSSVGVSGRKDLVTLTAHSSAPEVAFSIDGDAALAPAKVVDGVATTSWPSWGYADGQHTVHAVDCTAYGECGTASRAGTFTLANVPGAITGPAAGITTTGRFTVTAGHPSGGGLQLLIDGRPVGFDATAPYSFTVDGTALTDGRVSLQVQLCSTSGTHCAGPVSAGRHVVAASLHPQLDSVTPSAISPNRDGVRDDAAVSFTLPDTETTVVQVIAADGGVVRYARLGILGAGDHAWTWNGEDDRGTPLPDGRYTVAVTTSRAVGGFVQRGWSSRPAVVDTTPPSLTRPSGIGATFYPVHDGYRDTFTPRSVLGESATVTLSVRNPRGHTVRTISAARKAGPVTITWNGRRTDGGLVGPGRFTWTLAATDAAGNTRSTYRLPLFVSDKRLQHVTSRLTLVGTRYHRHGGSASCAYATAHHSHFRHGLRLVNRCGANSYEYAYGVYAFTVPRAQSYQRMSIRVYGHTTTAPSQLSTSIQRTDGGIEIPGSITIGSRRNAWHTLATVPAAHHINSRRHVYVTVILDSRYAGTNDFDLGSAQLAVTNVALR